MTKLTTGPLTDPVPLEVCSFIAFKLRRFPSAEIVTLIRSKREEFLANDLYENTEQEFCRYIDNQRVLQ